MNQTDSIVEISPRLTIFFGREGKMLKPTIAALLEQLPADKLATTDAIYQILMTQFSVQVVCPYDTKQALKALVPTSS